MFDLAVRADIEGALLAFDVVSKVVIVEVGHATLAANEGSLKLDHSETLPKLSAAVLFLMQLILL